MTAQVESPSRDIPRGSSRRGKGRWLRRVLRTFGYLAATIIGLTGFVIGLIGVNAGQRSNDPGDVWAGLIIGAVFALTSILWFMWLMGKKRRRH